MKLGRLVLGLPLLYLRDMRIIMFQLSSFNYAGFYGLGLGIRVCLWLKGGGRYRVVFVRDLFVRALLIRSF